MSLKKFVMSGIQDVLENQLGKNKAGGNQQAPAQQPEQSGQNQGNSSQQGGFYPNPNQDNTMSGGYGNQQQPGYGGGYPPQNNQGYNAYPPAGGAGAYPPSQPGYPPQGGPQETPYPGGGYPGSGGYPGQGGAAPPPIGFAGAGGAGYPGAQGGQGGYPPAQGGQGGYPPAQGAGYPPPQQQQYGAPSYPQQQQGYPPQQSYGGGQVPQGGYNPGYGAPAAAYGAPAMLGTPSIRPLPGFNANMDAEALRKAMKGLGCNNSKVIAVLCARTNSQRQDISRAFKVMYGKDLIKDLKSELSGDFEDLILALMEPSAVYDAKQLRKAMEGLGTKESVLIEIMTSRTNQQIAEVRMVYKQMFGKDLERDLVGETSGSFKRLLVSLCAGGRDEGNHVDPLRANQDARKLYSAGERRLGTDESAFNAILASQNYAQLRMVFDEYQKVTNHTIEKAVEAEFSGDIRDGLLAICAVVRSRPAYFAKLLHDSMKGLGTRDNDLIRLVVTRCEYDMVDIRNQFQGMYKTSLEAMIKGDCSGSYKDGLIALVKGNA